MLETWIHSLLTALALPSWACPAVFVISLISATLLPLGSEPAVFGLVKLNPSMFWPAMRWPPPATRWAAPSAGGWATAPSALYERMAPQAI
jgi:membrane protein YqaA with SNARE-associated domain